MYFEQKTHLILIKKERVKCKLDAKDLMQTFNI